MTRYSILLALFSAQLSAPSYSHDFYRLDQSLPAEVDVLAIAPVFDFDSDGCLPSAGISRSGQQNGGLKPSGSLTGSCRSSNFLETSNTLHRYSCASANGVQYCGHFFSLYFEKDQLFNGIESGHRHDWEYAAVWTENGVITHGSYSAHGDLFTQPASQLPFDNGHLRIVYHKEGLGSHALRFAGDDEPAENPYGEFVTPIIASWWHMYGDSVDNATMRNLLNQFDYGAANLPIRDSLFLNNLNSFRPQGYPLFSDEGR